MRIVVFSSGLYGYLGKPKYFQTVAGGNESLPPPSIYGSKEALFYGTCIEKRDMVFLGGGGSNK